jgi:hypothetical protein
VDVRSAEEMNALWLWFYEVLELLRSFRSEKLGVQKATAIEADFLLAQ